MLALSVDNILRDKINLHNDSIVSNSINSKHMLIYTLDSKRHKCLKIICQDQTLG